MNRSASSILTLALLAVAGCDDGAATPDVDLGTLRDMGRMDAARFDDGVSDRGVADDEGPPDPDRGVADMAIRDDGLPDDGLPDQGPPPGPGPAAYSELCVGCGAALSPRYRLVDHALRPVEATTPQAATSPRYRLILDPR
ncbi:MAG: hypothetical protein H6703_16645 [Myxococcales bacterium]|nr:hypothetical protein [Myxococcales bacterium]MCB9544058.1 hypothetical protein [Myxococcales bacterium]